MTSITQISLFLILLNDLLYNDDLYSEEDLTVPDEVSTESGDL